MRRSNAFNKKQKNEIQSDYSIDLRLTIEILVLMMKNTGTA
jgi:hypothetical protein